jgi:small-conductance mechanosensitive channel
VAAKLNQPWIPYERVEKLVQLEPALVVLGLSLGAWLIYRILLRSVSEERHRAFRSLFRNLVMHVTLGTGLFSIYYGLQLLAAGSSTLERVTAYIGLLTILSGCTVFIKVSRILVYQYLVLGHMRVAVPILLVNLFTFLLAVGLSAWLATELLEIKIAPLLATSAVFSLVLGLALQDTLGNLFAGVALQFDKPYEIGDWVEIQSGAQKWVGQVDEISWRATVLIGLSDETMTIPNRVIAQAEVSNFSTRHRPLIRSQSFRIPHEAAVKPVKETLVRGAMTVPMIRKNPPPFVIVSETTESWTVYKLVYCIDNYGSQWLIGDQVISAAIEELRKTGLSIAAERLLVLRPEDATRPGERTA